MTGRIPRKQLILEALAKELQNKPGERITTASLATAAGVSEAALYRHFASKAKMFEGLISFAEESVFARINRIMNEDKDTRSRCSKVIYLLLGFADRNPGITRILLGDALVGETDRLLVRVEQFFARIETQFRQIIREALLRDSQSTIVSAETAANLIVAVIEGRMHQYLRSRFRASPLDRWEEQWSLLAVGLFGDDSN